MMRYALLYDDGGTIRQRMSGTGDVVAVTAWFLHLSVMWVDDDRDYERTHRIADGKLVPAEDVA